MWESEENFQNYTLYPRVETMGHERSGKWYYHYRRPMGEGKFGPGGAWNLTQKGVFLEDIWRQGGIVTLS